MRIWSKWTAVLLLIFWPGLMCSAQRSVFFAQNVRPAASGGTVTHVQSCTAMSGSSSDSVACTFPSPVAAGDLLWGCINSLSSAAASITWSDSGTFQSDMFSASNGGIVCYYTVAAGGGETTITATQSSAFFYAGITMDEFHCSPACSLDVSDYPTPGVATGDYPTPPMSNTITPSTGDLVLGYSTNATGYTPAYAAGTGFTLGAAQTTGYASSANEYMLSSSGSVAAEFLVSGDSSDWWVHVVSFKP
jgi:hypothetical protein